MKTCADLGIVDFNSWCWQLNKASLRNAVIRAWFDVFGRECLFCDKVMKKSPKNIYDKVRATIDHIDARALGGVCEPQNLQVICLACNHEKSRAEDAAVRYSRLTGQDIHVSKTKRVRSKGSRKNEG